jgi:hypothetical protein
MSEICYLDRVVSIEGVRDPMLMIIVSTSSYLHFISYTLTLASLCLVNLCWRRLSSCILSWVCDDVSLDVGRVGYVIGDIASGISYGVSWSISYNISNGIDWLHYFDFTSSLFTH